MAMPETDTCPEDCVSMSDNRYSSELDLANRQGRVLGAQDAMLHVLDLAADLFKLGKDTEARNLRNISKSLGQLVDEHQSDTDSFRKRHVEKFKNA